MLRANLPAAYRLMHDGLITLAHMEEKGIRVDVKKLKHTISSVEGKIQELTKELKSSTEWKIWRRRKGSKANLSSSQQLKEIIFEELGHEYKYKSGETEMDGDEAAYAHLRLPFLDTYFRCKHLTKTLETYLKGIQRETINGRLHPIYNEHTTVSYRSSAELPNFQNMPVRNKEMSEYIRSVFIPSKGCVLVDTDYSGIEVRIAACYHKDPRMIRYIKDPNKDMHRDAAMKCYILGKESVSKDARYVAKNQFVFPQFYGDYYINCAQYMWDSVRKLNLKTSDGKDLYEHLAVKGIKTLGSCNPEREPKKGSFEKHIKEIERWFWDDQFPVYRDWKKSWYKQYQKLGHVNTYTGFHIEGSYRRNEIINLPIQGDAFHCLLAAANITDRRTYHNAKSGWLCGQIHDSIMADVPEKELDDYVSMVTEIMTQEVPRLWPWIIVPLTVETEVSNTSWFDKHPYTP